MVKIKYSNNQKCAGYVIAEVKRIPYYGLFDNNKSNAGQIINDFYTQFLSSLVKSPYKENVSFEIFYHSIPVKNQPFLAQVKMYFIVRFMGEDEIEITETINNIINVFKQEFESSNYTVDVYDEDEKYETFFQNFKEVSLNRVSSISKNEKIMGNMFNPNGSTYFNDVISSPKNTNMAHVTNLLTRVPNSGASIQIIPTSYNNNEVSYFQAGRTSLNYTIGQIRIRQGMQPVDPFLKTVAEAFDYYCESVNWPIMYCNCLVFAKDADKNALCNRIIECLEDQNEHSGALDVDNIDNNSISSENYAILPWLLSNQLVYNERNQSFWKTNNSPNHLLRLKYLYTLNEIKSIFKFPYDDDTVIGIDIRKTRKNREKLNSVLSNDDVVKLGFIQDSIINEDGEATNAGVPLKDFTMHGLIVGSPGSGKTYFSLGLLIQMWQKFNIPFLVIEPTKNEYRSLIDVIPELQVFTPGKSSISPLIINPFIPPKNVTVETYISSLMTAFKAAFSMPSPLPDLFLGAINEAYNEYGWRLDSTSDDECSEHFGMYEFIRVFKRKIRNMDYKGEVKSNIESAGVVRLISLIEQNSNIYDNINTIPLEDIISKPTVIELNAINNKEQKSLIMAFILTLICTYTKNNSNYGEGLKNVLLIDEAHVILGSSPSNNEAGAPDAVGSTSSTIEDMIAEVRACGTSIIIADQSPEKVGKGIVGNTNVKIIFRLVEKSSKDIIKNAINLSELDYERLATLDLGEAFLHHGRLKTEPLRIKTYKDISDKPFRKVLSDEELKPLCHYWDDKKELLIPHRECLYNPLCNNSCNDFVKLNSDFIASRILNMYYSKVSTPNDLVKLLWGCNIIISKIASQRNITDESTKIINCTKIKLLRKFLTSKNFEISRFDYEKILKHERFLLNNNQE